MKYFNYFPKEFSIKTGLEFVNYDFFSSHFSAYIHICDSLEFSFNYIVMLLANTYMRNKL